MRFEEADPLHLIKGEDLAATLNALLQNALLTAQVTGDERSRTIIAGRILAYQEIATAHRLKLGPICEPTPTLSQLLHSDNGGGQ